MPVLSTNDELLVALVGGATVKAAIFWLLSKKHRKHYVGKVSEILVYPVKSGRRLPDVKEADITKLGLQVGGVTDRHWLVTKKGMMQNISREPRVVLISSRIEDSNLILFTPGMPSLKLPIDPQPGVYKHEEISFRNQTVSTLDYGDEAGAWISKVIGKEGCRINYSAPSLKKRLSVEVKKDWPNDAKHGEKIAFSDFSQCMVMNKRSFLALNERIGRDMHLEQFRPNLLVDAETEPFDEDNWRILYIGDSAKLRKIDDCQRCIITTVNVNTAKKDEEKQPITELRKFRCKEAYNDHEPVMGIQTNVEVEGHVKLGDPVYVVYK